MDVKFVVIVYDISNDRRRTKLHTKLLDFGTPVQYSVFECLITPDQIIKLQKMIKSIVRVKKDKVRIYTLCQDCIEQIELIGDKEILTQTPTSIIVG